MILFYTGFILEHKLRLHLGPNHLLICSLNFTKEVSVFNCFGREFQTRGAKNLKMLSLKVTPFRVVFFFNATSLKLNFHFFQNSP